jgi:hypothetical protein
MDNTIVMMLHFDDDALGEGFQAAFGARDVT